MKHQKPPLLESELASPEDGFWRLHKEANDGLVALIDMYFGADSLIDLDRLDKSVQMVQDKVAELAGFIKISNDSIREKCTFCEMYAKA